MVSTVRVSMMLSYSQTSRRSCSRDCTRPRRRASTVNSVAVRSMRFRATVTRCRGTSMNRSPTLNWSGFSSAALRRFGMFFTRSVSSGD